MKYPPQGWGRPHGVWAGPVRAGGAFMALRVSLYSILVISILLLLKALCSCKNVLTILLFVIYSITFEMALQIIYYLFSEAHIYIAVQK